MQVVTRKPDETAENQEKESNEDLSDIEECAQDMISAIKASDSRALARAVKAAFEILDAQPHVEGEHIEE